MVHIGSLPQSNLSDALVPILGRDNQEGVPVLVDDINRYALPQQALDLTRRWQPHVHARKPTATSIRCPRAQVR